MAHARTAVAVVLAVLGALLGTAWAISASAVHSIEDGTAGDALVASVLESPQAAEVVADQVIAGIEGAIDSPRALAAFALVEPQVRSAVVSVVSSDLVGDLVRGSGSRAKGRLLDELSDPSREPGPFELRVDLSERIDARLAEVPLVGALVPSVGLPTVTAEVIAADAFEDLRSLFAAMKAVETWGLWLALLSVAASIAVSPRWRRFGWKALAGVGALPVVLALVLGAVGPGTLAGVMPGGRDGGAGVLVEDILARVALEPLVQALMTFGLVVLVIAAGWWAVLRWRRQRDVELGTGPVDLRTTSS